VHDKYKIEIKEMNDKYQRGWVTVLLKDVTKCVSQSLPEASMLGTSMRVDGSSASIVVDRRGTPTTHSIHCRKGVM
jgi:hypothetical protein